MNVAIHKEGWYQTRIIRWLKTTYPDAFIWKAQAGPYSRQGIPDVCCIISGCFYGFEIKRPGGKATPVQEITLQQITAAGGTAAVISYPEQAERIIRAAGVN